MAWHHASPSCIPPKTRLRHVVGQAVQQLARARGVEEGEAAVQHRGKDALPQPVGRGKFVMHTPTHTM